MDYTIKEAVKRLDMTVHTVRYYCDMGLVPNLRHDKNGNRIFDEKALAWLKSAKFLRECGMSIAEIRHYSDLCLQGNTTFLERAKILDALKQQTEQEIEQAKKRLKEIEREAEYWQEVFDKGELGWCI